MKHTMSLGVLVLFVSGCRFPGWDSLMDTASETLKCDRAQIDPKEKTDDTYAVTGCGSEVTCTRHHPDDGHWTCAPAAH
jgi:hypothetical protein